MTSNQLDSLKTHDEVLADEIARDPAFAAEWERTRPARQVAANLIRYRHERGLSQAELADLLAVPELRVAELESGERNLGADTLMVLSLQLDLDVADEAPAARGAVRSR